VKESIRDLSAQRITSAIDPVARIQMLADRFGEHRDIVRELVVTLGKPQKSLLKVPEVEERLSVSRSTVYRLIPDRELDRVDIDRTTRVSAESVDRFVERKNAESRQTKAA
jgi:excisionase family DNA binding protein